MKKFYEKHSLAFLLGLPVLMFLAINIGLDFNGLYGQDSHAYFQYANSIIDYFNGGELRSNFYWPKLFSFLGAALGVFGMPVMLGMQLISLLSLLGVLYVGNKCIKLIYEKEGSIFLLLGAATQVYFFRGGILIMSDMLAAFFVVVVYYFYLKIYISKQAFSIVYVLVFATLAVFSRYPSVILLVFPVLHALYLSLQTVKKRNRIITFILLGALAVVFVILNNTMFNRSIELLAEWNVANMFTRTLVSDSGSTHHWVPNSMYIFGSLFHIGYLSIGLFLLPFFHHVTRLNKAMLLSVIVYLVFLSGLATQNYRFFVLSHVLVLIFVFPAFLGLWEWLQAKKLRLIFIVGVLLFNIAFFTYSFGKTYRVFKVEKELVEALNKMETSAPIYSFYVDQSFESYGINNEVRNFYYQEFTQFESGAIVVFNENKFKDQWKGHAVMNNWYHLTTNYQLDTLATLQDNWQIYRVR
jgi:hypothetical protein